MTETPATLLQTLADKAKMPSFFQRPLWWLHGQGEILLDHCVKRIRDAWQEAAYGHVVTVDAAQLKEEDWYNFFQEVSLFGDRQLVFVRQADKRTEFPKWLTQTPRCQSLANTIILLSQQKEVKATISKEWQRLDGKIIALNDPPTWDLPKTLPWLAADFGFKLEPKAIPLLIETQGQDLLKIKNILSICAQLLPKGTTLQENNLSPLLGGIREDHAFRFYEYILQGNLAQAEALLLNLLERGEKAIALLGIISSFLRKMVHIFDLNQRGFSERDIAAQLGMAPFQAKQYLTFAKSQKKEKFADALRACQHSDLELKSSRRAENLILSEILATLS